jgi:hypothetical protein
LDAVKAGCHTLEPDQQFFAVLRHPYARAASQWGWGQGEWTKRLGYEASAEGMNKFIQDALRNASEPDEHPTSCNVRTFWTPAQGRFLHDCHWLPQSAYLVDDTGKRLARKLFTQDNLTLQLRELLGEPTLDPKTRRFMSEADVWRAEDGVERQTINKWLCELTPTTKSQLDRFYARDFEMFADYFKRDPVTSCP